MGTPNYAAGCAKVEEVLYKQIARKVGFHVEIAHKGVGISQKRSKQQTKMGLRQ